MSGDRTQRKRRWKKRIVLLAVALAVMLAAALAFLHTRAAGTILLRTADRVLRQSAGLSIEAREARFRPFALAVKLKDPAIRSIHPEETWIQTFTAERIEIDAPWALVFGKTMRLQKVLIVRPRFEAVAPRSPGPAQDIPQETAPPVEPESGVSPIPEIRIDALDLVEGTLEIDGGPASFLLSLRDIEAAVRFQAPAAIHDGRLKIGGGKAVIEGSEFEIREAETRFRFDGSTVFLDELRLQTADSILAASGSSSVFEPQPLFDFRVRTSLSLEEFLPLLNSSVMISGRLDLSGHIRSRDGTLNYSGHIESRNALLADLGPASLDTDFEGSASVFKLTDLSIRSEAGNLKGRADIVLSGPGDYRVDATWDGLLPDRWAALFQQDIPIGPVSSDGRIAARWPADAVADAEAEASILIQTAGPVPAAGPGRRIAPEGRVELRVAKGRISGNGRLSAAGARLAFMGHSDRAENIDADLTLTIPDVWGTTRILDGTNVLTGFLPSGLEPIPEKGGSAEVRGHIRGSLEDPKFTFAVQADDLLSGDLRLSEVRIEAAGDRKSVDFNRLSAAVNEGSIIGSGRIVFRKNTLEPGTGTSGRLELSGIPLGPFVSLLPPGPAESAAGVLHGEADILLDEKGFRAEFGMEAAPLSFQGMAFDRITARGRFGDGELTVEALTIESPDSKLDGYFGWDIGGGGFHASLIGNRIPLAMAGAFLPDGPPLEGSARLVIEGEGTFEEPRFTVSVSLSDAAAGDIRIPHLEFDAFGDGSAAAAVLLVPFLNLKAEAGIAFEEDYNIHGRIELPGTSLAAFLSNTPEDAVELAAADAVLSGEIVFDYPLLNPDGFQAKGTLALRDGGFLFSRIMGRPAEATDSGMLDARFSIRGDPADIENLEAELDLSNFRLSSGDLHISNAAPVEILLREGAVRLKDLLLAADNSELGLSGFYRIAPEPEIEARLRLKIDLAPFDALVPEARIGGAVTADLAVSGEPAQPDIQGRAEIRDLFARVRDFPLTLTGIRGDVAFDGDSAVLSRVRGAANGGSFTLEGRIDHGGFRRASADSLRLALRNFDLAFPEGFRSVSDADLELRGLWGNMTLSGEARMLRGFYREDIHPGVELLAMIRYATPPSPEDFPPFLRDLNLDINLSSVEPIRVRNNLADIELEPRLRVSGTPPFPLLSGQVQNARVGQAFLGDRRYTVESIRVEYLGAEITDFLIDIVAHTRVRWNTQDIEIRLHLSGPIDKPAYTLTSTNAPHLSGDDLAFLLLTGKTLSDMSGSALDTLGGQMIQYFATPLTSPVTEGLKSLLRAEDVVIEPLNIASEEDPGARLTFRKRVSDRASVTYSADITRSQRQTWILDYDLSRSFQISGFHKDDGTYGSSFKHSFTIGGRRAAVRTGDGTGFEAGTFTNIAFRGNPAFPDAVLEALTSKMRPGRDFSYGDLYTSIEDLLLFYKERGYVNAVISPNILREDDGRIDVVLDIDAGRPASFVFSGDNVPRRLKTSVQEAWRGEFPESANLSEARTLLLEGLRLKRYYAAEVTFEKIESDDLITYAFTVRKGGRYRIRNLDIRGGEPLSARDIKRTVREYVMARTKGPWNLVIDTSAALNALNRRYQDLGYRSAVMSSPQIDADPSSRTLEIRLDIESGPRSFIGDVVYDGLESFESGHFDSRLSLRPGSAFSPTRVQEDRNVLLTFYRSRGYVDAFVSARVVPRPEEDNVNLVYEIREGSRHTVGNVEVEGNSRTKPSFILKEARLTEGEAVSLETFARSKKRLYDTGIFRGVDISNRPAENGGDGDTVVVSVEESPPFAVTYGLRYNSEEKLEGFGELGFFNLFGGGRRGFFSYRENLRQTDLRFSLRMPYLFGIRFNTLTSLYAQKDVRDFFATETRGVSVQQEIRLPMDFSLTYLYRFNRIHTYELESWGPFPFDFTIDLSEFAWNLVRDRRDDRLNPQSGSFFSASLTYAPEALSSDLPYVSFFGQYTAARKLGGGFVWSSGLRLGLADAYDQVLIPGKRFYAGGGNSIRGFKLDSLGPIDPYLERAEGGEAVLIVNTEIRFPIISLLGGAVFYDFGNVYATARDISLSDLRHGAGFGLRADSPIGLLRLDLGFNINPRPGEPRRVLFFSIGQAF